MIHSPQWSIALWPETLLLNNHCTAAASNWSGHLSRGRNSHLLQLPQNHWPTHVQSRTGWPMGWGRCIFSQYHSDYAGWQSLLLRCHRTPTYIQISLAPQVANVQIMTGSMWPLMSSPKVLVRCWRSTTLPTIEQHSALLSMVGSIIRTFSRFTVCMCPLCWSHAHRDANPGSRHMCTGRPGDA